MDQPSGEATQLEKYPAGSTPRDLRFAVWSDADTITAVDSAKMNADPFGKMQPTARPPFAAITKPANAARFDGRHFTDMVFKSNDRGFVASPKEARVWHPSQIWMQAFGDSNKKQLTNTRYSHRDVKVSPDGRWIAFVADVELRVPNIDKARQG